MLVLAVVITAVVLCTVVAFVLCTVVAFVLGTVVGTVAGVGAVFGVVVCAVIFRHSYRLLSFSMRLLFLKAGNIYIDIFQGSDQYLNKTR